MRLLEIILGMLLLLLLMGMDAAAINMLFGSGKTVMLVSALLVLECLFMLSYHYRAVRNSINSPPLARWNKRFHWSFLMLTLCCVGVFAAHDQGMLVVYRQAIQWVFWGLFAVLVMVGGGLALYLLLDAPEADLVKPVERPVLPTIQYGKAGYR